jgi:hypothetical protein
VDEIFIVDGPEVRFANDRNGNTEAVSKTDTPDVLDA